VSWRDRNLQPGSFKGVRFHFEQTSGTGGRRVTLKRLAGGGIVPVDLEDEPDEFEITAFVVGEDYDLQRDALERALKEGGTGPLVLPRRGSVRARVTRGPQTTEIREEGGYCTIRFSIFVEEGDVSGLRAAPDTAVQLKTASAAVATAAKADAGSKSTKGFSRTQLERASGLVQAATTAIRRVNRFSASLLTPVTSLTRDLDALNQGAIVLMSTPSLFATTLIDLIFTAYSLPQTAINGVDRLAGIPGIATTAFGQGRAARMVDRIASAFRSFGEPFGSASGGSSAQVRAEEVRMASARLVRAASISAASAAYADVNFDSATFAVAVLGRTIAEIDQLQQLEPPDDLFAALDDLRAALALHIYETASRLRETIIADVRKPVPALLLAYVLYGDATQEADIVARNALSDPAFVQGRIEVLRP
jgi:prophage DNA circulation protein